MVCIPMVLKATFVGRGANTKFLAYYNSMRSWRSIKGRQLKEAP
jgi:hypothetical protein